MDLRVSDIPAKGSSSSSSCKNVGMEEIGNSGGGASGFSFLPNPCAKSFVDVEVDVDVVLEVEVEEGNVKAKANAVVVDKRRIESDNFIVVVVGYI